MQPVENRLDVSVLRDQDLDPPSSGRQRAFDQNVKLALRDLEAEE